MIEQKITRFNADDLVEYDGEKMYEIKERINIDQRNDDMTYSVIAGDDLRTVAHKIYDDARLYWVIAEYNGIIDPFEPLPTGLLLRCPSLKVIFTEMF